MEPGKGVADSHHFEEQLDPDPDPHLSEWIRIRIKVKGWIWIRIQVKSWIRIRI